MTHTDTQTECQTSDIKLPVLHKGRLIRMERRDCYNNSGASAFFFQPS